MLVLLLVAGVSCSTYEEYEDRDRIEAIVDIDSVPQGADVYVSRTPSEIEPGDPGGEWIAEGGFAFLGRTPIQIKDNVVRSRKGVRKVLPGGHVLYDTTGPAIFQENVRRIVLLKPRYKPVDAIERIGAQDRLVYRLEPIAGSPAGARPGPPETLLDPSGTGRLSITSRPPGAEVSVDGRLIGQTPASVHLSAGEHELVVEREGFERWVRRIEVLESSDQTITAVLAKGTRTAASAAESEPAPEPEPGPASGEASGARSRGPAAGGDGSRGFDPAKITLTDQDGNTFAFKSLSGRPLLVSFIYSRCPSPSMCPLVTRKFVRVQRELAEVKDRVRLLLITLDPEYDTPRVLREYGRANGADFSNLWFVTGTKDAISALEKAFGIYKKEERPGVLAHTMDAFLIDASGNVKKIFPGAFWNVDDVADEILALVKKNE